MTRGLNSHAQNRGCRLRMDSRGTQNLESEADRLNAELSVAPLPDESPTVSGDGQFGLTEVIALFVLAGSVALLNIRF